MSQHNRMNPTINFSHVDGAGYESQPYQFNDIYSQQWISSDPRTVIPSVPSPTDITRTDWTAAPRIANQTSVSRPRKVSQQQRDIDPRLQGSNAYLLPPGLHSSSTVQHNPESIANPIARFYHQQDQPWNALGMGMRNPQEPNGRHTFHRTQVSYGQYRQGPCSDLGSNVPASDSGYCTQPTRSVLGDEPGLVHQELPLEVMDQARNLNVHSALSASQEMVRTVSDQRSVSQHSSRNGSHKQQFQCLDPDCNLSFNCKSEHKKHMLKHEKKFVCDVPGCKRGGGGFSTVNDLDRHKKSVHKIGMTNSRSWQCAAGSCTNKNKIWPRLDNFKQHIERMHKEEDVFDLIIRSEYSPQEQQNAVQPLSVDPSHLLAGVGSEAALATGGPNDNTFSASMHNNFGYPQFMSITGRSHSGASQISPGTDSLDMPTSKSGPSSLYQAGSNASITQSFPQSIERLSKHQLDCQKSSCVSSTGKTTKPTSAQEHHGNPTLQLQLSSAPQTKSEQQRQRLDLDKLSRAKLQAIVLQVLESQQQDGNSNHSDSESHKVLQEIAQLVQSKSRSTRLQQLRSPQASASGMQQCHYEDCNFLGRTCDLNKHLKRHDKPYGCTYPKCHKKFGAKSDWKRHENSQHFQQETFRCDHLIQAGQKCGQHYYRVAQFQNHLEHEHKVMSKEKAEDATNRCKIGKNCQGQYWCGFCCEIKRLRTRRNHAWDERFDHIAHHFERDTPKKSIDDWICVEENKTKKQLQEEMLLAKAEKYADAERYDADDSPNAHEEHPSPAARTHQASEQEGSRKRKAQAGANESGRPDKHPRQATILWTCCECGGGPVTHSVQVKCPEQTCQHTFCSSCVCYEAGNFEMEIFE